MFRKTCDSGIQSLRCSPRTSVWLWRSWQCEMSPRSDVTVSLPEHLSRPAEWFYLGWRIPICLSLLVFLPVEDRWQQGVGGGGVWSDVNKGADSDERLEPLSSWLTLSRFRREQCPQQQLVPLLVQPVLWCGRMCTTEWIPLQQGFVWDGKAADEAGQFAWLKIRFHFKLKILRNGFFFSGFSERSRFCWLVRGDLFINIIIQFCLKIYPIVSPPSELELKNKPTDTQLFHSVLIWSSFLVFFIFESASVH